MASRTTALFVVVILMFSLFGYVYFREIDPGSGSSEVASSPAACASGQVLNQVQEDASGNLILSCVVVSSGGDSASSATCASNQFMVSVAESSSGTITITCVQPSFNALTNYPPNCSTNQFVYGINGGLLCSQVPFNGLSNYPANCPSNQFVYGINGGLLCSNVPGPSTIRVLSDQTNTATTAKSTTLTATLQANTNYIFTAYIYATNTASPASSINFQIHSLPSGASLIMACGIDGAIAITSGNCKSATGTNIFGTSISGSTSTNIAIVLYGTITVGSTSGTLQIDFVDGSGSGTATVKAGSFMIVQTVA